MSARVNLLLLLSAMLSALTGAGAGARPAQVPVACAQAAESIAAEHRVAPVAAARPVAALPRLVNLASISGPRWRLAAVAMLFLSRRRE